MKHFLMLVGGICGAAAGILLWESKRAKPVDELAHRLEVAWANNHTVV